MKKIFQILVMVLFISVSAMAQNGYKIGSKATDFSLMGTDGEMHSLKEIEGAKGYIVIFTCNHCPYSVAYEDRIIALQAEYAPKGYSVIAINPNDPELNPGDSYENMRVRAKEKQFNFLYLFDEGQKVYPKYGATKTPHVFLLDAKRKVRYIGAIDDSTEADDVDIKFLANAIDALIANETPSPANTKAIGCGIKAKK
ncbi:MAG: peroxiredoxin [Planctomycetota bacterium]|jgi:peroxiredoxin